MLRCTLFLITFAALLSLLSPAQSKQPTPTASSTPPLYDTRGDQVGLAQETAHTGKLQGRILWMDAGANVGNLNTTQKIKDIVAKVKAAGFNMIVLDVKPIVGDTIYPSKFAPKLTAWKGQTVPADFDVLAHMLKAAHAAGLPVYANMSTFSEGHKLVGQGMAYVRPTWQSILYEVHRSVSALGGPSLPISTVNALPKNDLAAAALTDSSLLTTDRPGDTIAIVNFDARVVGLYSGNDLKDAHLQVPWEGAALIGYGRAGQWLRTNALPNTILTYKASPLYVPIQYALNQKYAMFCDPFNPSVRQHELDIVREIVTHYDVNGIVFDDRLRYAGLNADFGWRERAAFDQYVGHTLHWPNDVYRASAYPGQPILPGPYFQRWLTWRAGVITSWLADACAIIRSLRPQAQVAVYVGSWYGDYYKVGSNWAAPDVSAPFFFLTPRYKKTGFAPLLDWLTTGCYYTVPTIAAAAASGSSPGATVEAAGQLSNLVVNDSAWTYAGLYALSYQGHPNQFIHAIGAATASTQGVMVFDMSQIIDYNWWSVIRQAFGPGPTPPAPSMIPDLLSEVRHQHNLNRQDGVPPPPFPSYIGVDGTGF